MLLGLSQHNISPIQTHQIDLLLTPTRVPYQTCRLVPFNHPIMCNTVCNNVTLLPLFRPNCHIHQFIAQGNLELVLYTVWYRKEKSGKIRKKNTHFYFQIKWKLKWSQVRCSKVEIALWGCCCRSQKGRVGKYRHIKWAHERETRKRGKIGYRRLSLNFSRDLAAANL